METRTIESPQLASRLKVARKRVELTQEQAAMFLGVQRTTLIAIEQGKRRVSAFELSKLAACYGMEVEELLHGDELAQENREFDAIMAQANQQRVVKRLLKRQCDPAMRQVINLLELSREKREALTATLLQMLIEEERVDDAG